MDKVLKRYKTLILGGGASACMCAIFSSKEGVAIIDANTKPAKKVLVTGNGRCNLTNKNMSSKFFNVNIDKYLNKFNLNKTLEFFNNIGLEYYSDEEGRVYPLSFSAKSVQDVIIRELENKIDFYKEEIIQDVLYDNKKYIVKTDKNVFESENLVVSTGGKSYVSTGSTGDGYTFAENCGHKIIEPKPALVGICLDSKEPKMVEGLSLKNVRIKINVKKKTIYESPIGEMLFTSFGVSGPLVLSASSYINRIDEEKNLFIDFKPALENEVLLSRINREIVSLKSKQFSSLLELLLPKSLVHIFAKRLGINLTKKVAQLTENERVALCNLLKNFDYRICGLEGFDRAVVTSGGVDTKMINPSNMKSKVVENLQFIGEVIDIDALTGGYNLQLAWSTAAAAASVY